MALLNVVMTKRAEEQFNSYVDYIFYDLANETAARSVIMDLAKTKQILANVAEGRPFCKSPRLAELGYKQIRFRHHRYVMLYRVIGETVYVEAIYHELQDYENTFVNDR